MPAPLTVSRNASAAAPSPSSRAMARDAPAERLGSGGSVGEDAEIWRLEHPDARDPFRPASGELQADAAPVGVTDHQRRVQPGAMESSTAMRSSTCNPASTGPRTSSAGMRLRPRRAAVDGQDSEPAREGDGQRVELQGVGQRGVQEQSDGPLAAQTDVDACPIRPLDHRVGRARPPAAAGLPAARSCPTQSGGSRASPRRPRAPCSRRAAPWRTP